MNKKHREAIGEGQVKKFLRQVKEIDGFPEVKPCAECGEWKPLDQFSPRKRKLKSGLVSVAPASYCKACQAARAKENRERWMEKDPETWKEMRRRHLANEDPVRRRERHREVEAARRRAQGKKPRKFKNRPRTRPQVPTEPLALFLDSRRESSTELEKLSGISERRVRDIRDRAYPKTDLETVDRILLALDCQHLFEDLYPTEEKFYGYKFEDPDGILDDL